ncbi:DnaB-like helicase C-terminal domain-containing protein [Dongshaea marina]|uniref:DnaB-like helicase C-terminal domain-containing protein n=1 Tax=Dongshaea marina TaxID=2047966 RepID=UPI000D3ED6DB|nr:DnaB-like helicase C-terminal domain-containing protein [Dongshaea marina]
MPPFFLSKNLQTLKKLANKLKRAHGISHARALELVAAREGYSSWSLLLHQSERHKVTSVEQLKAQLHQTSMLMVAARPNAGKVSAAINFALESAKSGRRVCYVSLNSSPQEIRHKLLCVHSVIEHQRLTSLPKTADQELQLKINRGVSELSRLPLQINSESKSCSDLLVWLKQDANARSLVVVDDIQSLLYGCEDKEQTLFKLKELAQQAEITLMLISQLTNRESASGSGALKLGELQLGSMIARHCEWVIALQRANPACRQLTLEMLKARYPVLERFSVDFDPETGICHW